MMRDGFFERARIGRQLGRVALCRDASLRDAGFWTTLALILCGFSMPLAFAFLLAGAFFARMAVREQRQFDSILTRSIAAALAESEDAGLQEAA